MMKPSSAFTHPPPRASSSAPTESPGEPKRNVFSSVSTVAPKLPGQQPLTIHTSKHSRDRRQTRSSSPEVQEDVWLRIEHYLVAAYTTLRSGDESTQRPLKAPSNRMSWYAVVYNMCHTDPVVSRELYTKVALAVLHALETLVLYPILQHADRQRLRVVTGMEGQRRGDSVRSSSKSGPKNASFSFLKRLLFNRDGGDHNVVSHTNSNTRAPPLDDTPPASGDASFPSSPSAPSRSSPKPAVPTDGILLRSDTGRIEAGEEQLLPEMSSTPPDLAHQCAADMILGTQQHASLQLRADSFSFCRAFVDEYKCFVSFRRVVMSCFSYLDQYYTRPCGMDTIAVMCTKLFYVAVYEPVKVLLVDELLELQLHIRTAHDRTGRMSAEVRLVQETLGSIADLLAAVQATSSYLVEGDPGSPQWDDLASRGTASAASSVVSTPRHGAPQESSFPTNSPNEPRRRWPFNLFSSSSRPREDDASPLPSALSGVDECLNRGADNATPSPTAAVARTLLVDLRGMLEVRARLESRTLAATLASHARNRVDATDVSAGGVVQTGTIIVEVTQSLQALVMGDVGEALISGVEAYYREERAYRLSSHRGSCRHYVSWLTSVFDIEKAMTKEMVFPFLHAALRHALNDLLVVEVHRTVILAPDCGFQALLEICEGTREDDAVVRAILENGMTIPLPCEETSVSSVTKDGAKWAALGAFFDVFARTQDEGSLLLLGSVFASKVINDCVRHIQSYLSAISTPPEKQQQPPPQQPQQQRRYRSGMRFVASPQEVAGIDLVERILGIASEHLQLVQRHLSGHSVLLGALTDSLAEVLNPFRWSKKGSLAASELRVRGAAALVAGHGNFPSVLLSRDGVKAMAPLAGLLQNEPSASDLNMQLLLANYCDALLSNEGESGNAADLSECLTQIATLVTLLDDKDVFLEGHRLKLAKRLMGSYTVTNTAEGDLVQKLQVRIGAGITHGFYAMIRDSDNSVATCERFQRSPAFLALGTPVRVQVLSASLWPPQRMLSLLPHRSLQAGMDAFHQYYVGLHAGRTLTWLHALGGAALIAEFPKGNTEVLANTIQATLLLHVSEASQSKGCVTGSALAEAIGLPFQEIQPHLASIVLNRTTSLVTRRLGAAATSGPLQASDRFILNAEFFHRSRKLRLPIPRSRNEGLPLRADGDDAQEALLATRRQQLDTAIVRILKCHRVMPYAEVASLAAQQVSRLFLPTTRDVKARVEDLIDRGFVRRDDGDRNYLEYLS